MRLPWSKRTEAGEQSVTPVIEPAIAIDLARSDECPMIANGPDAVTKGESASPQVLTSPLVTFGYAC
jgi:hypothetical protein